MKRLYLLVGFLLCLNLTVVAIDTHLVPGSVAAGPWTVRVRPDQTGAIGDPTLLTKTRLQLRRLPPFDPSSSRVQTSASTPAPFWTRFLAAEPADPQELRQLSVRPFGVHQPGATGLSLYALSFVVLGLVSGLVVLFIPERLRVLRETMARGWRQNLRMGLVGFVVYATSLLFSFALTILFVGIPFAFITVLGLIVVTFVGVVAVCLGLGYRLSRWTGESRPKALLQLLVGLLVVFPLSILPYAGWLLMAIVACVGLGAIVYTRFGNGAGWTLEALE